MPCILDARCGGRRLRVVGQGVKVRTEVKGRRYRASCNALPQGGHKHCKGRSFGGHELTAAQQNGRSYRTKSIPRTAVPCRLGRMGKSKAGEAIFLPS